MQMRGASSTVGPLTLRIVRTRAAGGCGALGYSVSCGEEAATRRPSHTRMSSDRLRVLVVGAQFPYPPRSGFETRFYQLLRQLQRRYEVTLLTYVTEDNRAGLQQLEQELTVVPVPRVARSRGAKRIEQ